VIHAPSPGSAPTGLTASDREAIETRGMDVRDVEAQLELFANPPGFVRLDRPCTVGDGIERIPPDRVAALLQRADRAAAEARVVRFVPASGAASRMFDTLLRAMASAGDEPPAEARHFIETLPRFAFAEELRAATRSERADWRVVLRAFLGESGLRYAGLPKGLLQFHRYPDGPRTAFEEHLREGVIHTRSHDGRSRQHFTVSPEHRPRFDALVDTLRPRLEAELACRLDLTFSTQDPCTDTIAVDPENRPFRTDGGTLLFRPGGHGALLRNLQRLDSDIVTVKNIDNIVPDHLRPLVVHWKKLLTGLLAELQDETRRCVLAMRAGTADPATRTMAAGLARRLGHTLPKEPGEMPAEPSSERVVALLDRPLRVCGMVRNEGEPGGGPFWVTDAHGQTSPQIVEGSQVDPDDPVEQAALRASTHFNPVDLVCGVRDPDGQPYDLARFIDPRAVFISRKSHGGRPLKALERPGLWNGAMAHWSTVFVEVPGATFAPVKTVFDLLRPEHQPPS